MIQTKMQIEPRPYRITKIIVTTGQTGTCDFFTRTREDKPWAKGDKEITLSATNEKQALENHIKAMRKAYKKAEKKAWIQEPVK